MGISDVKKSSSSEDSKTFSSLSFSSSCLCSSKLSVFLIALLIMILVSQTVAHGTMSCFGVCRRSDVFACRRCRHREPLRFGKRGGYDQQLQLNDMDYVLNDRIPAMKDIITASFPWNSLKTSKILPNPLRKEQIFSSFPVSINPISEEDINTSEAR